MSFAKQLGLPATGGVNCGVTTVQAQKRLRPVIDKLMGKAENDGQKKRIIEALLIEADRISEEVPFDLKDAVRTCRSK